MNLRMGIRGRLLLLVLSIAALSVVLTAIVVQRVTSDQLSNQVAENRLTVDSINISLNEFALTAATWGDANEIVAELSQQYETRIALVDLNGHILVDSAQILEGETRPLPAFESGYIDPSIDAFDIEIPEEVEAQWLAEEEFEQCVLSQGVDPVWFIDDPALFEETAAGLSSEDLEQLLTIADQCWQEVDGVLLFDDPDFDDPDFDDPNFDQSFFDSDPRFGPGTSSLEPALLFLGESGESGGVLDSSIDYRMVLSLLAIGTVATASAYLLARRILAPISVLTQAAQEVADGGRPEPVEVIGDSELSELAVAFNSMGSTLRNEEESRRRLTTDIAHELRSPLQNIRGTLEAAQDGVRDLDLDLVDSVHEEALLLQHLVDDLQILALADAAALHLDSQPVSINELLDSIVRSHSDRAAEAGVQLINGAPAGQANGPIVAGDNMRLRQVFSNLVDNAIRHSSSGDVISLQTELVNNGTDPLVRIDVRDTGEGIPQDFLPQVFDRFSRADPSRTRGTGGSGVGLAICQKLVEAHGGTIAVTSDVGVGTSFVVELPVGPSLT